MLQSKKFNFMFTLSICITSEKYLNSTSTLINLEYIRFDSSF